MWGENSTGENISNSAINEQVINSAIILWTSHAESFISFLCYSEDFSDRPLFSFGWLGSVNIWKN